MLNRLCRIPGRIRDDYRIIRLAKNWRDVLYCKTARTPIDRVLMRCSATLSGPSRSHLDNQFHEIWVRQCYTSGVYSINKCDTVIDIGANIGVFSVYAAKYALKGWVFAFEPVAESRGYLLRNASESQINNLTVFPFAVAATVGKKNLRVSADNLMTNSVVHADRTDDAEPLVECITLDQIMVSNHIEQCDLLKIDCEGSEYEILQGCSSETLTRIRRIVGEYHEGPGIAGSGEELCRFLRSASFTVDQFKALDSNCGVFLARNLEK